MSEDEAGPSVAVGFAEAETDTGLEGDKLSEKIRELVMRDGLEVEVDHFQPSSNGKRNMLPSPSSVHRSVASLI